MGDLFDEVQKLKSEGKKGALATIIGAKGSTPREVGAKMLIREDGTLLDETFDMVILSIGFQPHSDVLEFAKTFDIDLNEHRFAKTTQFQPIETSRAGVYVTGIFQCPKDIPETVAQASGAAAKVCALFAAEPRRAAPEPMVMEA